MKHKVLTSLISIIFCLFLFNCTEKSQNNVTTNEMTKDTVISDKKYKILHIMSYHAPWKWTDDQLMGFKESLSGLNVEYKIFQMDTKRKSSPEWIEEVTKEAKNLIDTWKPDLVYTNDDNAQKYIVVDYINSPIPFVFSGVNSDPSVYGFIKSKNIAGVLEQEHFVETVRFIQSIVPGIKRIAVITDDGPTWPGVLERMRNTATRELRDVEMVSWNVIKTFDEYKKRIKELEKEADAVALLGLFTFKDAEGNNVPLEKVARWTAENSKIPDFTFWKDRIDKGHFCTVTVSGYQQGLKAGEIAREILEEGKAPAYFSFKPTVMGEPVISLARAKVLGVQIPSDLLLSVEIIKDFDWNR